MIRPSEPTHAYVGTKSCGCRVAACVDYADTETRHWLREMDRDGYAITREPLGPELKVARCIHKPSKPDNGPLLMAAGVK